MTCILTCINSKIIEIIRIKSVFDKNKNHVEKVVDLITTWFFSIYIIVVSFYCTRVGCDIAAQILFAPHLDFNPRTRVGCDGTAIFCGAQGSGLQSTHPRGVRHIRHHTAEVEDIISIHAPAWGATAKVYKIICKKK